MESKPTLLTLSKRFEFSASRKVFLTDKNLSENKQLYGNETAANYGAGYNFELWCSFEGEINRKNGMIINIGEIKKNVNQLIEEHFDHKYLNVDCSLLKGLQPTTERIAILILEELQKIFTSTSVTPSSCFLRESPSRAAVAYTDGTLESIYNLRFSAARRTCSPILSDEENFKIFGHASSPSGHGHNYKLQVSVNGEINEKNGLILPYDFINAKLNELHAMLDHKNLNTDVKELAGHPITTESLSKFILEYLSNSIPVSKVRLNELPEFFAEINANNEISLGMRDQFSAAHRLHSPMLSDDKNFEIYEKCNNKGGHGHLYQFEATISAPYDQRTGIIFDMIELDKALRGSVSEWEYKHLDLESDDFKKIPSTSENIVLLLWTKLNIKLKGKLNRLRLWETNNNKFTVRLK